MRLLQEGGRILVLYTSKEKSSIAISVAYGKTGRVPHGLDISRRKEISGRLAYAARNEWIAAAADDR
jgi:hypothetical protein